MKAYRSIPCYSAISNLIENLRGKNFEVVPVKIDKPMRPVEIRRFIRNLRQTREYTYTNDIIYWG